MSRWFRFYEEAINDDKVRCLSSDALRWQWVVLLTVASKYSGEVPSLAIAAENLRLKPSRAAEVVASLARAGLLDRVEGGYFRAHNWKGRQPVDATAAERKRRQRERERDERDSHAVTSVTVTPLEERVQSTEGEIDQRSLTSLQITNSEAILVEGVKEKSWSPPKHCAISRDKKHVYIEKNTPEWEAYASDYRAVHHQDPQPNAHGGKWFAAQGEAA